MNKKTIKRVELKDKRVILRAALDVPLEQKRGKWQVKDETRIRAILPTLEYLLENNCRVIILTWLSRPGGKVVEKYRLDPVASKLEEISGYPVKKLDDCVGPGVEKEIIKMKLGEIIMLENVRFHPEEEANDSGFARRLASLADLLVMDAFAQAHRDCASINGIPKFIPAVAGLLLEKEINTLSELLENPLRPLVAIIGGVKISTKIKVIESLLKKVNFLLLGGALANTILKAQGIGVGKSIVEETMLPLVKKLKLTDNRVKIPVDVVTADKISPQARFFIRPVGKVEEGEFILDIGEDTINLYSLVIQQAKTIVWNGPMGMFELKKFALGTNKIAQLVAQAKAKSIIGGGETIAAVKDLGLEDKISFISTGGGAMLKFLEGAKLPGIEALLDK